MPKFNTKEEYEKWKAQRLEDIKSHSSNASEHTKKDEYQLKNDSMDDVSSGSFRKNIGKIIVVSLIFFVGILFYSLLPKDRKPDDALIPKSQMESDTVRKSVDTVANTKEPASLSQPAAFFNEGEGNGTEAY